MVYCHEPRPPNMGRVYTHMREIEGTEVRIKPLWKIKEDYQTLKRRARVMKLIYEGKPVLFGAHVVLGTGMGMQHMYTFECYIDTSTPNEKPSITGSCNE